MAMDPRKRQKKQERRNAKQKAKKRALAQRGPRDVLTRIERTSAAPILHCCTTHMLWDEGMSNLLWSRELDNGKVAYVIFLVDVYCLGVKNVAFDVVSRSRYDWQVHGKVFRDYRVVNLEPAAARKLIEGAVEYALELGLPPYPDYRRAKLIFGDVDAAACTQEFTYGKDGKPFFIAGPHDGPGRCQQIISVLNSRCGPDGFHYMMPMEVAGVSPGDLQLIDDQDDIEDSSY